MFSLYVRAWRPNIVKTFMPFTFPISLSLRPLALIGRETRREDYINSENNKDGCLVSSVQTAVFIILFFSFKPRRLILQRPERVQDTF
jgi:hypothetical protein